MVPALGETKITIFVKGGAILVFATRSVPLVFMDEGGIHRDFKEKLPAKSC